MKFITHFILQCLQKDLSKKIVLLILLLQIFISILLHNKSINPTQLKVIRHQHNKDHYVH